MLDIQQIETWTTERVELLKTLWPDNSASQCAAKIGGVSRNAVISKVHRIGLDGKNNRPRMPRQDRLRRKREYQQRYYKRKALEPKLTDPRFVPIKNPPEPPAHIAFLGMTFEALPDFSDFEQNVCRYPRGEDEGILFCGQPTGPGETYCSHCRQICCPPAIQRRRVPR